MVDASVAVKWFAPEANQEAAMAILGSDQSVIAPDLVLAETMHALRRKLRAQDIDEQSYLRAAADLPRYFDQLVPTDALISDAADLSVRLDHGFYDCVYLALAQSVGAEFASADAKFIAKVHAANLGVTLRGVSAELR